MVITWIICSVPAELQDTLLWWAPLLTASALYLLVLSKKKKLQILIGLTYTMFFMYWGYLRCYLVSELIRLKKLEAYLKEG